MNFDFNFNKNSGVYVDSSKKFIFKFYLDQKNSNKNFKILNEYKGNYWYLSRIKNKNIKNLIIIKKQEGLSLIKIPFFFGKKYKFWKNFLDKKKEVFLVLKHYKTIWPKTSTLVPYHGDLTLSNIIFTKNEVRFIDWENYENNKLWGLDISYFLLSLIILPSISNRKNTISKHSSENFIIFWNSFFKNCNFEYLNDPISYLRAKTNLPKNNFINLVSKNFEKKINYILNERN